MWLVNAFCEVQKLWTALLMVISTRSLWLAIESELRGEPTCKHPCTGNEVSSYISCLHVYNKRNTSVPPNRKKKVREPYRSHVNTTVQICHDPLDSLLEKGPSIGEMESAHAFTAILRRGGSSKNLTFRPGHLDEAS